MAAGVRVVGLDHVAEQERRSAVGVAELERVVDPDPALPCEQLEQPDQRHDREEGVAGEAGRVAASRPTGASARSTLQTQAAKRRCARGEMPNASHSRNAAVA